MAEDNKARKIGGMAAVAISFDAYGRVIVDPGYAAVAADVTFGLPPWVPGSGGPGGGGPGGEGTDLSCPVVACELEDAACPEDLACDADALCEVEVVGCVEDIACDADAACEAEVIACEPDLGCGAEVIACENDVGCEAEVIACVDSLCVDLFCGENETCKNDGCEINLECGSDEPEDIEIGL